MGLTKVKYLTNITVLSLGHYPWVSDIKNKSDVTFNATEIVSRGFIFRGICQLYKCFFTKSEL